METLCLLISLGCLFMSIVCLCCAIFARKVVLQNKKTNGRNQKIENAGRGFY